MSRLLSKDRLCRKCGLLPELRVEPGFRNFFHEDGHQCDAHRDIHVWSDGHFYVLGYEVQPFSAVNAIHSVPRGGHSVQLFLAEAQNYEAQG